MVTIQQFDTLVVKECQTLCPLIFRSVELKSIEPNIHAPGVHVGGM